jgi:hypothetical protein
MNESMLADAGFAFVADDYGGKWSHPSGVGAINEKRFGTRGGMMLTVPHLDRWPYGSVPELLTPQSLKQLAAFVGYYEMLKGGA